MNPSPKVLIINNLQYTHRTQGGPQLDHSSPGASLVVQSSSSLISLETLY
ncbi:unnamed protein product [Hymenolepis diminuta]|uniref:Uncharacterized protein n=1 Tax=Hymenolepis diminuta TaxID=6216 RepID=A0A564ZDM2_HYMDI|nr:unnamed protein product [Hymenolepis diminuta]